jgi:hypothetical protein
MLGSSVPSVDFEQYAAEFAAIDKSLSEARLETETLSASKSSDLEIETIRNPHVLCVSSQQFRDLGFGNQLQTVLDAFPAELRHEIVLDSATLKRVLVSGNVDIIHIAAYVCPRSGDLYFSSIDLARGFSSVEPADRLRPDELVALLKSAKTRLVVLGASASLILAAQMLPVTNVIATRDMVSANALASWIETFYKLLMQGKALAEAFDLATSLSHAPMQLYGQQRSVPSITFQSPAPGIDTQHTRDLARQMQ